MLYGIRGIIPGLPPPVKKQADVWLSDAGYSESIPETHACSSMRAVLHRLASTID